MTSKRVRKGSPEPARRALPMRPFSQSLPMALLRAREAVMRKFRSDLRAVGVTEQQWRILRALANSGPMEVTALADTTFLLAPSLSRILPDMEARQLVSRRQVDGDLRRSVVSLEPRGLRLIAQHAPSSERTYEEITRRYGAQRLEQLFALLRELEETLSEDVQGVDETVERAAGRTRARGARRARG